MFYELKEYLQIPLILISHILGDTLGLYLGVTDFAISGVLFKKQDKVEKLIYYISLTLQSAETRYPPIKHMGLDLSYASQKCR